MHVNIIRELRSTLSKQAIFRVPVVSSPIPTSSAPSLFRMASTNTSTSPRVYVGPVYKYIHSQITSHLSPSVLEIRNESHGRLEDESHFHVLVVSEKFNEANCKSVIQRHRMVQNLFMDETNNLKFHALRITAKTPQQWEKTSDEKRVKEAPKCTGKGDGRGATDVTKLNS